MKKTTSLIVSLLALTLCVASAWASTTPPPADTLKVDYFSNANTAGAPDGTLRLTNPGTSGGNIYAAIFVFDPEQELTECCECLLTPDGLRTLSVDADLTSNPLTGVTLKTGLIKIASTTGTSASRLVPTPAASQDATFSASELSRLDRECSAVQLDGSGHGICSCGTGD